MSIHKTLSEHAKYLVEGAKHRKAELAEKIARLEQQLAQEKLALNLAGSADEDFAKFLHALRTEPVCPECWFSGREKTVLIAVSGGNADRFLCVQCRCEFDSE